MAEDVAIPIFVPEAFEEGETRGTVLNCTVEEDTLVAEGDVIARLRMGTVDADIESPVSGKLVRLYLAAGRPVSVGEMIGEILELRRDPESGRTRGPSASSTVLVDRAPPLFALLLASGALVWSMTWLAISVLASVVSAALAVSSKPGGGRGPADAIVVPARIVSGAYSAARAKLARGFPVLLGLARALAWTAIAMALAAAAGALPWLIQHGTDGLPAAVRLSVYAHALRIFAFLASFWLLRTALRRRETPARIKDFAAGLPETGLVAAAGAAVVWLLLCLLALTPREWWPSTDFRDFAHGLPPALRDGIEDGRTALIEAEAQAVVRCLREHGSTAWRLPRAHLRAHGEVLVGVRPVRRASGKELVTLMLALHNQLAAHGPTIEILSRRRGGKVRITPRRGGGPLSDADEVAGIALSARSLKEAAQSAGPEATKLGLRCSASAI